MPNNVVLKAAGIQTFQNYLGSVSEGALIEALNVVIDRNNIIEPRRGFAQYGTTFLTSNDRAKQLFSYKNRILRHVGNEIQYDGDGLGTFGSFTGSVTEVIPGVRINGTEANSNFYFVSATGVRKISASSASDFPGLTIEEAGGVKALDLNGNVNYSTSGFLTPSSQVAYRVVWGITDINDNLILGVPSNRLVIQNVSPTQSGVVDLQFAVPSDVTTENYFYQIYRTGVFTGDPGDEMYLVFEDFVTSAQITAGEVLVTDITPEDFRRGGALLYTNPQSGEGIAQANEKPPFARDLALYKGYMFYANTSTVQRLNLSMISIQDLVSEVSEFTVTDGTTSTTYRWRGAFETYTADFSAGGLTKADFVAGASNPGFYFEIDAANDERKYYVWYKDSTEEDPNITGRLGIEVDISAAVTVQDVIDATETALLGGTSDFNTNQVAGPALEIYNANNGYVTATTFFTNIADFTITSDDLGTGEDASLTPPRVFLPRVPSGTENGPTTSQQIEQAAQSIVRVINLVDPLINAFYVSGFDDVPGQILFENRDTTGGAFWITADSTTTGAQFTPALPTAGQDVISTNEIRGNRIYYSKFQQPEAVPLVNYIDVGPQDRVITRIVALRDSLFIFKEDGIYRLSGETAPFAVAPFDFSLYLTAPDSAVVLNNQIYAFTTQGVITVTDTGVSVISRPIENLLLNITRPGFDFKTASFGVSYESDRSYHLWTVTDSVDEVATQCFRYNTFTNTWTRWDNTATCGLVHFADNKMYLGAGDKNFIEQERKSLTRTDFADRDFDVTILPLAVNGVEVELGTVTGIEVGDRIIQTQYMTISQYNRLLQKLDQDPFVADADYFSTLEFSPGENPRDHIQNLALKLDADTGIVFTNYFDRIDDYTQTITSSTPGASTIITFASNDILTGRFVTITGSDVAVLNGTWEVTNSTGTTITVPVTTTVPATMGSVDTPTEDFRDVQGCFNLIVQNLNNDAGAFYINYVESEGTIEFETVILAVDDPENMITLNDPIQLMEGPATIFESFQTRVIWAPQFFNDPSVYKQVSEGTLMFENTNYTKAAIAYSTDLSPFFEAINFNGGGDGDWGQFDFGNMNWGGVGAATPLRTYIPRQKQRCRFMNIRFEHKIAMEKFSLYGISLVFRPYSTRGYR